RPVRNVTIAVAPRAQYAFDNSSSYEQFSGGNYTVGRGYDPGAAIGDSGIGSRTESRIGSQFPKEPGKPAFQPYAFFDAAWIWNRDKVAGVPDPQRSFSAGAGVRATSFDAVRVDGVVAVPSRDTVSQKVKGDMRTEGKAMVQSALHAGRNAPASRKAGPRRVLQKSLAGASTGAAASIINAIPSAGPAWAQAVNGAPTVVFGANAPVRAAGSDTITVNAHDASVDWTATDAGGVFSPTGNTSTFNADTSVSGAYTVLNRVRSSAAGASPLQINGTVNSGDAGRIWFYNPTGWVVGSSGAFNVGSSSSTASP
ncbi:hypothetical protein OY671_008057, partial [Metschnikowia pulcherrima]